MRTAETAREVRLTHADTAAVEMLAWTLCRSGGADPGRVDDPAWVEEVRGVGEGLPLSLRSAVRHFRRDSGPSGTLLVRDLPVDLDGLRQTPSVAGSVQRAPTVSAAVLVMMACELGDPTAFRAEKSGALVQDVVPVPGSEETQGNVGSVHLTFHNENAFHQHRPDYVLLLCLRADHDRVAGLRTVCAREVLPLLDARTRSALFRAEYVTEPPPSFGPVSAATAPHPVLSGAPDDPDVRVDLSATGPVTPEAGAALAALRAAFDRVAHTVRLVPGDLAVVDNRVTLHGRTGFRPRYDGADRWLQRTFVAVDLRRSRDHRPDDGYVLVR